MPTIPGTTPIETTFASALRPPFSTGAAAAAGAAPEPPARPAGAGAGSSGPDRGSEERDRPRPVPDGQAERPARTPAHRVRVGAVPQPRPGRRLEVSVRPPARVHRLRLGGDRSSFTEDLDELSSGRPMVAERPPSLPDPTALCCSVVRAAVEVLRGDRAAVQLTRWLAPPVLDQLVERARLLHDAGARGAGQGAAAADRTGSGRGAGPVHVRRVRVERLRADVAEATVILEDDGRVRACAVRLEARRGIWRIAVLELG